MDLLSLALFIILYGIVAALGVFILASMFGNMKRARRYFDKLAQQLQSLRLNRMLSALGIDTASYLATQKKIDIEDQMKACEECRNTEQCDQHLAVGDISPDAISYCNNEEKLRNLARQQSAEPEPGRVPPPERQPRRTRLSKRPENP